MQFSPDGRYLASCGGDNSLRIFTQEDEQMADAAADGGGAKAASFTQLVTRALYIYPPLASYIQLCTSTLIVCCRLLRSSLQEGRRRVTLLFGFLIGTHGRVVVMLRWWAGR